jgi:hypothetical protein
MAAGTSGGLLGWICAGSCGDLFFDITHNPVGCWQAGPMLPKVIGFTMIAIALVVLAPEILGSAAEAGGEVVTEVEAEQAAASSAEGLAASGEEGASSVSDLSQETLGRSNTVESHLDDVTGKGTPSRPYVDSDLTARTIMETQGSPDEFVNTATRWDAAGSMNGTAGTWQLVYDHATNTILHFVFVTPSWNSVQCDPDEEGVHLARPLAFEAKTGRRIDGFLMYRETEHSIDFTTTETPAEVTALSGGSASLLLDTLQLAVGVAEPRLLFPYGYCPRESWRKNHVQPPKSEEGIVIVQAEPTLRTGEAVQIDSEAWGPWWHDPTTNWLSRTREDIAPDQFVEVAAAFVVGLSGNNLASLLLHPSID